jgi:16S rRNA (cytidine1402-2'-O)-methyltransferase
MIFFESPHRIEKLLDALRAGLGNRRAVLAREMTKHFEEFVRGTLDELLKHVQKHSPKGEITLIVEGAPRRKKLAARDSEQEQRTAKDEV